MPSKSKKQARFMAACAHGAGYSSCPPKKVAVEFNQADAKKKRAAGGKAQQPARRVLGIEEIPKGMVYANVFNDPLLIAPNELDAIDQLQGMYAGTREPEGPFRYGNRMFGNQLVREQFIPRAEGGNIRPDLNPFNLEGSVPISNKSAPVRAYHGTNAEITKFSPNTKDYYLPDRTIGPHFSADPAVASKFASGLYRRQDPLGYGAKTVNPGARVYPVNIDASKFKTVNQPLYDWAKGQNPGPRNVLTDQEAIARLVNTEGYRARPDILERYLINARKIPEKEAREIAKKLSSGEEVKVEGKTHTLDTFISNFNGTPYNKKDALALVEAARGRLIGQGYTGLRYTNTSPMETEGIGNPMSFIPISPGTVKSSTTDDTMFARGGRAKSTKAESNYRPGHGSTRCANCTMFRSPNSCTAVSGHISPRDLCDYFERKGHAEGGKVPDVSVPVLSSYLDNLIANITDIEDYTPHRGQYGNVPTFNRPIGFTGTPFVKKGFGGILESPFDSLVHEAGDVIKGPWVPKSEVPLPGPVGPFYGGGGGGWGRGSNVRSLPAASRRAAKTDQQKYDEAVYKQESALLRQRALQQKAPLRPLEEFPFRTPTRDLVKEYEKRGIPIKKLTLDKALIDQWSKLTPQQKELYLDSIEDFAMGGPIKRVPGGMVPFQREELIKQALFHGPEATVEPLPTPPQRPAPMVPRGPTRTLPGEEPVEIGHDRVIMPPRPPAESPVPWNPQRPYSTLRYPAPTQSDLEARLGSNRPPPYQPSYKHKDLKGILGQANDIVSGTHALAMKGIEPLLMMAPVGAGIGLAGRGLNALRSARAGREALQMDQLFGPQMQHLLRGRHGFMNVADDAAPIQGQFSRFGISSPRQPSLTEQLRAIHRATLRRGRPHQEIEAYTPRQRQRVLEAALKARKEPATKAARDLRTKGELDAATRDLVRAKGGQAGLPAPLPKTKGLPPQSVAVTRAAGVGMAMRKSGLLKSSVPGRTDKLNLNVKSGSYVIPADVVAGHGQGNSLAGGKQLDMIFKQGPYGVGSGGARAGSVRYGSQMGAKAAPAPKVSLSYLKHQEAKAHGGGADVPVLAAGGEYIVEPQAVASIGGGNPDQGFRKLDQFVMESRKRQIKELQGLKPPRKN